MVALPNLSPIPKRVAVVVNLKARKVKEDTVAWLRTVVPAEDLYLSQSLNELPLLAERLVSRRYEAVLWAGGDGTFTAGVESIAEAAKRRRWEVPDMGVLPLGTGNALALTVGARPATPDGVSLELSRARASARRQPLPLLSVEGRPAVFCGFGLDAQILDDFGRTVAVLERLGLAVRVQSAGWRYALAVATRSIPRFALSDRPEVVAVNRGSPAVRVDLHGEPVGRPIPTGRVLWRGRVTLAGASTIPFYGLGFKMFPQARRMPGRFQVRLSDLSTIESLARLPKLWHGRTQGSRIHDFLVDRVELMLSRPAPFQASGDVIGERRTVSIALWERTISMV